MSDVTRRNFIKGAGVLAAAAAATTTAAFAEPQDHRPVGLPESWDAEADVVVVGYGGAGACTAITAADDGCDVIIVEKYPCDTETEVRHTPSSRFCGANCVCVNDPVEGAKALDSLSFHATPQDVCEAWGKGAATIVEYWRSLGADFPEPSWTHGEYPELPGCMSVGQSRGVGRGAALFRVLKNNIEEDRADKIQVMWETAGTRIIMNYETMEVAGIVAMKADGTTLNIKARKGVCLCTGGFEWDETMKMNFLRGYPSYFYTNPNNDGSGIKMGEAVGGALWHMNAISARAIPYCEGWDKGTSIQLVLPYFFVNKYGERWFYDSPWPSHNAWVEFVNFSSKTAEYKASPAWVIYDNTSKKPLLKTQDKGYLGDTDELQYWQPESMKDEEVAVANGWLLRADTPEELAALIAADPEDEGKCTPEVLAETFEKFNAYCAAGKDEDFDRAASDLIPLATPPFFAVKVYPGGPNTQGGLKKNGKGQVVNAFDEPIKRLYCCGENGSVYGFLYPCGGGNVCEMGVFGQVCGHELAAQEPWA